jgi:hypothetical protein
MTPHKIIIVISFKETIEHLDVLRQDTHQARKIRVRLTGVVEQRHARDIRIFDLLSKEQTVSPNVVGQEEVSHANMRHHHHTEAGTRLRSIIPRRIEICKGRLTIRTISAHTIILLGVCPGRAVHSGDLVHGDGTP